MCGLLGGTYAGLVYWFSFRPTTFVLLDRAVEKVEGKSVQWIDFDRVEGWSLEGEGRRQKFLMRLDTGEWGEFPAKGEWTVKVERALKPRLEG